MLRTVIFDFDGVIADTELLHYKALNRAFGDYGVDIPRDIHWSKYLGLTDIENISAVNADYQMGLDATGQNDLLRKKTAYFIELAGHEKSLFQGVAEFVKMLRHHDIPLAVCSGATANDIELILADTDLYQAFEAVVTADDIASGKPSPQGYLLALEKINVSRNPHPQIQPSQCVAIEDSHWGLQAAATAGMHTVAIANTYPSSQLAPFAQKVVAKISELSLAQLRKLCD